MPGLWSQLKALNQNLSLNQKLSILGLGTVVLFGILGFVYLVQNTNYQPLISDLDAESVQLVLERLRQKEIDYELANGGRSVLVPEADFDEAMLEIAGAGLSNKGRVGFEIFDEGSWNVTEFGEKVKFRRAVEGELERTIRTISEISSVRVHVAFEKESLFREQTAPAKASVVLGLRGSEPLPQQKVISIRNLVASAVQGLSPDHVTVVSTQGTLLSGEREDETMLSSSQLQTRQRMEEEMSRKVQSLLERTVGESRLEVRTSLALDFSRIQQKELIKDPVILSEVNVRRPISGATGVGGVPGVESKQGGSRPRNGGSGDSAWASEEQRNYDYTTLERQVTSPGGAIERISIAVIIDDKVVEAVQRGRRTESREPWSEPELQRLRGLVASTVGLDTLRGDQLTLENVPFVANPAVEQPPGEPGFLERNRPFLMQSIRYLGIIALFLLFYWLVLRPVKNRVFAHLDAPSKGAGRLGQGASLQQIGGSSAPREADLTGRMALGSGVAADEESREGLTREERLKAQLSQITRQDPESLAGLIREWLSQGT